MLLLEGAETYGLGSWADIADHIGGFRTKDEVRDHYIGTCIESSRFPLPERANPGDKRLSDAVPREEFQSRKKRRIEERREAARNAPPATPKQKPTASVPACHEVQGYMPGRLEFETEYFNEAEEAVQHMSFDPGDGRNPKTGELEPEMELKMVIMDIYNARLTARVERKKIIFEHQLLEYRKNAAVDKRRTKEQRELHNKVKPFARMLRHDDFEEFAKGLEEELDLRQAIAQLQEWRLGQIGDIKSGLEYEKEKQQRALRQNASLQYERMATSRKPAPAIETPLGANEMIQPELPPRLQNGPPTPPPSVTSNSGSRAPTNGNGGASGHVGAGAATSKKQRFVVAPIAGIAPLKFTDEHTADLRLLGKEERELCSVCRLSPKAYALLKEAVFREALKHGGSLKKKAMREICRIDVNKCSRLFDLFVWSGWITKA